MSKCDFEGFSLCWFSLGIMLLAFQLPNADMMSVLCGTPGAKPDDSALAGILLSEVGPQIAFILGNLSRLISKYCEAAV